MGVHDWVAVSDGMAVLCCCLVENVFCRCVCLAVYVLLFHGAWMSISLLLCMTGYLKGKKKVSKKIN